jgi:urease accessory protein
MTRSDLSLLRLIQLTDSAFPTGAFAHSFGLETYVARGLVRSASTLEAFVTNTLIHALAPSDGVACVAVYGAEDTWLDITHELDQRLTAMKTVSELRQASRLLGARYLRTVTQLFSLPRAASYLDAIEAKTLHGHLSLAYGSVCWRGSASIVPPSFRRASGSSHWARRRDRSCSPISERRFSTPLN